jgi:hypothetical protein
MRARSTRLAGSIRDRAIDVSSATVASSIDKSIARRLAALSFLGAVCTENLIYLDARQMSA